MINGEVKHLNGTLVNVSANNPAACLMGGFKQLHSAFRKCRHCMAEDKTMQTLFKENQLTLRNRSRHCKHCEVLSEVGLEKHNAITNGVERNAILNTSRYFHVVDGMPPDIMHDNYTGRYHLQQYT